MANIICKAVYDETLDAWRIFSPYSKTYIEELKHEIPAGARSWDALNKAWMIVDEFIDIIDILCLKHFGGKLNRVVPQSQLPPAQLTSSRDLFEKFLKLCPTNAVKKLYLAAISELHPDKGGDPDKAKELNILYANIKVELGIK